MISKKTKMKKKTGWYLASAFDASIAKAVTTEFIVDSGPSFICSDFCVTFFGFLPILLRLKQNR